MCDYFICADLFARRSRLSLQKDVKEENRIIERSTTSLAISICKQVSKLQ